MVRRIALLVTVLVVAGQVGVITAASASAATVPSPQSSDCVQVSLGNGGFEAPVIPATSVVTMGDAAQPSTPHADSWLTTASDHQVEYWSTGFNGVPAAEGNQFVELNANEVSSLYQVFDTSALPAGATIRWSLKHRGRSGVDVMRVNIGPSIGAPNYASPDLADGTGAWGSHSGTYVLPAGQPSTTFAFVSVSSVGGASFGNFLDDVAFATDACVTLHKTVAPAAVRVGAHATYTIVAKNEGGADATGLVLSDVIPADTTYVPGSLTVDGVAQADPSGSPLTVSLGTLPSTTTVPSRTVVFKVMVGAGAAVSDVNEATASYVDSGTAATESSVSGNATFTVGPSAVPDTSSTGHGVAAVVPILANDAALTADPLDPTTVVLLAPAGGTQVSPTEVRVTGEGDYRYSPVTGAVTFTPDPAFTGTVAHPPTYTVQSAGGATSNAATITPTVGPAAAVVTVTGTVVDATTGQPIPGATVTITDKSGHTYTTTAGPDGSFTFIGTPAAPITPGRVSVRATKQGYVAAGASVVVAAGTPASLVLSLVPMPSLPDTGNGAGTPLLAAVLLLETGLLLVLAVRRRRTL